MWSKWRPLLGLQFSLDSFVPVVSEPVAASSHTIIRINVQDKVSDKLTGYM